MKINNPITTAEKVLINTAAAAKSLIFLICLLFLVVIKSAILSMAEFIVSTVITNVIEKMIISHSKKASLNSMAKKIASMETAI